MDNRQRKHIAHSPRIEAPPPAAVQPVMHKLATYAIEIALHRRPIEHIMRWVTGAVYEQMLARTTLVTNLPDQPSTGLVHIGRYRIYPQHDGALECTVMLAVADRFRVVSMRLEMIESRWKATALDIL